MRPLAARPRVPRPRSNAYCEALLVRLWLSGSRLRCPPRMRTVRSTCGGCRSMAAGEYVSVSSQADTENADLDRERKGLATGDESERNELAAIYDPNSCNDSSKRFPEVAHQGNYSYRAKTFRTSTKSTRPRLVHISGATGPDGAGLEKNIHGQVRLVHALRVPGDKSRRRARRGSNS